MKKNPQNLPVISIVTPSLNQGKYIEKTIKSVLDQQYPCLEHIIMDGGSIDNTLDILKKYQKNLVWKSAKDKGQSAAINKGLKKSAGDILCYINSDDYLLPRSLHQVARIFQENQKVMWLTGKCRIVDENNRQVRQAVTFYKNFFLKFFRSSQIFSIVQFISQPSTFWRRSVTEKIGYFDESLNYDMDYDYWLRIWQKYPLYFLDDYLSAYRIHPSAKAVVSPATQFKVQYKIVKKYRKNIFLLLLHRLHARIALIIYRFFY